jgi:hypothetical protein
VKFDSHPVTRVCSVDCHQRGVSDGHKKMCIWLHFRTCCCSILRHVLWCGMPCFHALPAACHPLQTPAPARDCTTRRSLNPGGRRTATATHTASTRSRTASAHSSAGPAPPIWSPAQTGQGTPTPGPILSAIRLQEPRALPALRHVSTRPVSFKVLWFCQGSVFGSLNPEPRVDLSSCRLLQ